MEKEHRSWAPVAPACNPKEAVIRRIMILSQSGEIVPQKLSHKKPSHKKAGGVTEGIGPEFNS
jgi:hypothetical protein